MSRSLLTVDQLANRLGLRPSTIRRWVKLNKLPALRPSKTVLRFDWDEVVAAIRRLDARHHRQLAGG